MTISKHSSPEHESGLLASRVLRVGTRSHAPLQPDWLSIHSTAKPARCITSSKPSAGAPAASNASLPIAENMHGNEAAVLVPQDMTLL